MPAAPQIGLRYRALGRYGMLILFAILFLGGFAFLMRPVGFLASAAIGFAHALAGVA